jgi:plasmid stabilization system protein ParE
VAYLVRITDRAARDFASLYDEIDAGQSRAALKWYTGFKQAILSLEELPYRCPVVRKKGQVRQLSHGRKPHIYLVFYRILEKQKQVDVLHIRHGARVKPSPSDLA